MSSKMLQPKKSHRLRNFFLIVAVLVLGIIVIGSLQQAKHSIAPSQSTTSSQTATQSSPAPAAATTSEEPSPAPATAPMPSPAATVATPPEPSPPSVATAITSPEPSEQELPSTQTSGSSSRSVVVSADEYGDRWPLTVSEARVVLIGSYVAILYAEGESYALNGMAQSRGYAPIDSIWRDNPDIPGTKVSISPLIQLALSLGTEPVLEQTSPPVTSGNTSTEPQASTVTGTVEAPQQEETTTTPSLTAPPEQKTTPAVREIAASVSFTGTRFVITNHEDQDWVNVRFELNPGLISSGYTVKVQLIEAGATYTVGAMQFVNSKGERFNPYQMKPQKFNIVDFFSEWPQQAGMEGLASFGWQ